MNNLLTDAHRPRIGGTPFKWCLELERCLDICTPLIQQLVRRWDSCEESFRLWQHLVPFGVVDVCISLGLSVLGEEVQFDGYACGCVASLFSGECITIKDIVKVISYTIGTEEDDVDSVCRVLENLDSLVNYNWAGAVHKFLVNGLSRAHLVDCNKKNQHKITLPGCVVVLQIWAFERLGLGGPNREIVFPRILRWPSLKLRTTSIERLLMKPKWKRIAELWRVVWVVGGGGFRGKWWGWDDPYVPRTYEGVLKWKYPIMNSVDFVCEQLVRRWDSCEESFRLWQHLVPFGVVDVCISLGLSVLGEEVQFDGYACGCVASLFSGECITIKDIVKVISYTIGTEEDDVDSVCRVLENLDSLVNYNWARAVHKFLVNGLSRAHLVDCNKKNQHKITLPGCVVVLQIWAFERLGLGGPNREIVFPRILRWPSLKLRTTSIERLLMKPKIIWDWALTAECRSNPMVRAALNIDGEAVNEDDVDCGESNFEEACMKKVEMNEMEIISLKEQLKMLQDEVFSRGKWSSQEDTNVGDDKGDLFEESGQKPTSYTDGTK
ncbi:mRNA-capping enzyme [Vigna unguiculata]|uniref:mRNA-capping enzyme n=1 Tax=Vigna unguiculata TaxID=3917 RepID=A0A4D6NQL1_VIGUN|nr:mRNA-capping enzyme [Vigna unguiculata]